MSKIGKAILFRVYIMFIVALVANTVIFCALFNYIEMETFTNSSEVAVNVLLENFQTKADETSILATLISQSDEIKRSIAERDTASILKLWNSIEKSNAIFAVFTNSEGVVVLKTDNCNLSSTGIFDITSGSKSGLFSDVEAYLYYSTSIKFDGGAVAVGFSYSDNTILDDLKEQTNNQVTVFSDNLRIATTFMDENGVRQVGTTMLDNIYDVVITNGQKYQMETELFGEPYLATYTPIKDSTGSVRGAFFTGSPMSELKGNLRMMVMVGVGVGVVLLIAAAFILIIFITQRISRPVVMVKAMAQEMEQGNLRNNPGIQGKVHNDEIGELAGSITIAVSTLNGYISDISDMMEQMAEGNFSFVSKINYRGDFMSIGESAKILHDQMKEIVGSINVSSSEVFNGSAQLSSVATIMADGTIKQASATQELSASMSDISNKIAMNIESAEKAQQLSHLSIETINEQKQQIEAMLGAMTNIEDSTNEIGKIIKSIDDLAFQTNILALNAAVEAARAGTAGKGFAVVADEVRNLANKSADAASNTSVLIGSCIEAVNHGAEIARRTSEAMNAVIDNANNTNSLIDDITSQTHAQDEAVQQVRAGMAKITEVVQQNSANAEQSAASCEELNAQATALREKIAIFKT
ncbi:MAG: cache domain-containing protein [Oscillospiraceae bacterium]|nr:cache domain-containing protein [Oscillospiraceae bacterium]